MHFGFTLDSSDVDLWNIDLLNTHFFKTCSALQFFVFQDVFKTFSRCLCKTFSWRLCKTFSRRLGRRKLFTLKTCWRRLQDMSWRRLVCWGFFEYSCKSLSFYLFIYRSIFFFIHSLILSFIQFVYSILPATSSLLYGFHMYTPLVLTTLVQYFHAVL